MFCGGTAVSTTHVGGLIDDSGAVINRWMVHHTEDQLHWSTDDHKRVFKRVLELRYKMTPTSWTR